MQVWWSSMTIFEQVFWYIALPFSVIFIIQLIMTFAGLGGHSGDVGGDFSHDGSDIQHDHPANEAVQSFNLFTLRNFIAFFTILGWTGIACIHSELNVGWTIGISIVMGLAAMFLVAGLFYFISRLSDSGNVNMQNAIGQTGNVYIPLRAKAANTGKVSIAFQGALREMPAITQGDEDLATGTLVRVTGISGGTVLIVEKNNS